MPYDPIPLSDDEVAGYPAAAGSVGVRMTSAVAGTFRLIPQNPRRRTLFISRVGTAATFYVRPFVEPTGAGLVVSEHAPNLVIDGELFGLYVRGIWWIECSAAVDLYVFECLEDPEG